MNSKYKPSQLPGRQSGIALIIIIVVIVIGAAGVFMATANFKQQQIAVNNSSHSLLDEVKKAIVGWSVSHPNKPGMLPWPDLSTDSNFDGNSDCISSSPSYSNLLGRVPWLGQTSPCVAPLTGMSIQSIGATGSPIYYAASPNLVYNYNAVSYPTINSSFRNLNSGWLTVIDNRGNVLSNRVAFVVIAPGRALNNQQRNGATPGINQYLDSITINGTSYSNANTDGIFISGHPGSAFNDLIQYVTIDQLMDIVEKRVLRELKKCLDSYASNAGGYYPFPVDMQGNVYNGNGTPPPTSLFGRFNPATSWPSACMVNSAYFSDWQNSSFYMVAPEYVQGGSKNCSTCLQINSSGNYPVVTFLAGAELSGQSRVSQSDMQNIINYLEGINLNPYDYLFQSGTNSSTFNDKVMCIDGNQNCK